MAEGYPSTLFFVKFYFSQKKTTIYTTNFLKEYSPMIGTGGVLQYRSESVISCPSDVLTE